MTEFSVRQIDISRFQNPQGPSTQDYSVGINPNTILRDPRFLQDYRDELRARGEAVSTFSDEDLIEHFYSDNTWGDLNTVSAMRDAADALGADEERKARLNRLQSVWQQLPYFWQQGGRGTLDALGDIIPAVVADPINLIPGVNAYARGAQAARGAAAAGQNALRAGIASGARAGAVSEGLISGAQEGIVNTANQIRDVQLGLRDEFSTGELALSAGAGAVLGAGVGGLIGAGAGAAATREGVTQARAGQFLGLSPEQIARMTPQEAAEAARQAESAVGPFEPVEARQAREEAAAAEAETPEQEGPTVDPEFANANEILETRVASARRRVIELRESGADEEVIAEAEAVRDNIVRLRGMLDRMQRESEQITALGRTNDPRSLAGRDARLRRFERDRAELELLIRQSATMDPEELTARVTELEGSAGETPPSAQAEAEAGAQTSSPDAPASAAEGEAPAATETPEATEAPEAEPAAEAAPIQYANDAQRERIAGMLESAGMTEDDLRLFIAAGRVNYGSRGRLTNRSIRELNNTINLVRSAADEPPAAAAVETPDAPSVSDTPTSAAPVDQPAQVSAPPIADDLRGEALFAGVDYRNIQPSPRSADGRLTRRIVRKYINARSPDAEPEEYATIVQQELDELLELMSVADMHEEEIRAGIRLIAEDAGSRASVDDLLSLFDYVSSQARREDGQLNESARPFTDTELKRIKRRTREIKRQNEGFTTETAEALAKAEVAKNRGLETTPVRGTGEAIERGAQLTTAGRTNSGRIQEFLRRGTRIGKGSDYTITGGKNQVRPNEFGLEAALIKARSGTGPDIVPYTLMGTETVMTRSGKQPMKKGSVAYADALTGRSYESMELALEVRGDAPKKPAPTATRQQQVSDNVGDQLRRFMEDGDAAGFRKLLQQLRDGQAADPKGRISPASEKLPLMRGDKLLIARSKIDPADVRMISPKQARAGKDITAIIGQKGKKANPDQWEVKYAPKDRFTRDDAELAALFDALPDEAAQDGAGGRYEAGLATGMGKPLSPEESAELRITDLSEQEASAISYALGTVVNEPTLAEVFMASKKLESSKWKKSIDEHRTAIDTLRTIYGVMDRVAPQGMRLDETSREFSVNSLRSIFSKYSAEQTEAAAKFIERLGGDPTVGPGFVGAAEGTFHLATRLMDGVPRQGILLGPSNTSHQPALATLYHEVAHWAYDNILTPKDRLDFWELASRHYGPDGKLDRQSIQRGLPQFDGMKTESGVLKGGNQTFSPQEYFANQFELWATRSQSPELMQDAGYWKRIARFVKAIFDRYVRDAEIEPDLEPLFAKILPPDQADKVRLGVDAQPKTPAGEHYRKRYVELQALRADMEDAIARDSADAIGTAAGELTKFLLSVAPRSSTEARPNTGTLAPLKRLYRLIHQRIDDMDEIVSGKPFDYSGLGEETTRVAPEWLEMGMQDVADPQAVADLLRDFYFNGYAGQFEPANGIPGNIQKLEKSSVSSLLDMIETALEGAYRSAESGDMLAGTKPRTPKAARPKGSKAVRTGRKRAERIEAATDRDAKRTAATPAQRRTRKNPRNAETVDPTIAEEIKTKSIKELRALYRKHRGTARGDQVAFAILDKERAQPLPPKAVAIPQAMRSMRKEELDTMLLDALHEGNSEVIDQVTYEMRRRFTNRGRKRMGMAPIQPVFNDSLAAIQREITDSVGVTSSDGIPSSARASIREMLSYITHRDPIAQQTARTMTYRMLNLLGKTARSTMDEVNVISTGDVARLANVDPSDIGTAVFADMRAPEFRKLRADMRRMAIGLTKGDTSPTDIVHEVGHMIVRSGMLKPEDMDAIREAYRLSNDATKQRVQAAYGAKYANRIDGVQDDLIAEEWFAESLAEYLAERVTRSDLLAQSVDGNLTNLKLRSRFDSAIDRVSEYIAYVFNGLVGRNDIKQQFRRLFLFGDMFEQPSKSPLKGLSSSGPSVHPSLAADAVSDSIMGSPRARLSKIRNYIGDGLSYNKSNDTFVPFYHGTPNGYAFNRADNPDVVMRVSKNGNYGPGIYFADNPDVASQVYSRRPTPESMRNAIEGLDISDDAKSDLIFDAMELGEVRQKISQYRRKYAQAIGFSDDDTLNVLREALDDFVEMEAELVDHLAKNGVTTDPMVVPVYLRVSNPADFQTSAIFQSTDDPLVRGVLDYLNKNEDVPPRAYRLLAEEFQNGALNGQETYAALAQMFVEAGHSKAASKSKLNSVIQDLGYDGLLTTHNNTVDMPGGSRMPNGDTYQGASSVYKGVVVFDPENAKHVDASEFDTADERLFHRADQAIPRGTVGEIVNAMVAGEIDSLDAVNIGSFGETLEMSGVNPSLSGAIMSMRRGRTLDVKEEQALRKTGPLGFLQSQSTKMEALGANWLAGWYKNHFPDLHQKFARKYFPLHHALRALPDADGKVRAWARSASAGIGQTQPESYKRIVRALRYGAGSRQEKALNTQERRIWTQIRNAFASERRELINAGVMIGDRGPNYLPQVWNTAKIQKNRDEFLEKMMRYYKVEATARGEIASDDAAMSFAEGIYKRLGDEDADGVFIPQKSQGRGVKNDHIDYGRVIELEKYPAMMKELEPFLEDDLEFLLVKYFEGTSRRMSHAEKLGINNHALYDYLMVAEQGQRGIERLLTTNKEFRKDIRAIGEDGYPVYGTLKDTVRMPFSSNPAEAKQFVAQMVAAIKEPSKGVAAVRQMLNDVAPRSADGTIPLAYQRRADAILGALQDYKGQPAGWQASNYEFIENAMRVAMKKPQTNTGSRAVQEASKFMRSFNNVTLLGFTTLTSLGDLALPIIRSGSFRSWASGLQKVASDPEYRRMINDIGVAMENIVHERMIYMYGAVDNKASNAFFNATMLTPWTDMNRKIAGATGYEALKTMQAKANRAYVDGKPIANQSAEYKTAARFLTRYGLADYLPNGKKSNVSLSDRALLESDEALRRGIIQFADESIFQPNPNDIPLWAQTPIGGIVFQLKSFPLMMSRLGADVIKEARNGNVKPLLYFATLGPAFGMGALGVKDIVQSRGGEDERSMELRDRSVDKILQQLGYDRELHGDENDFLGWYLEGIIMMGGLGLLGDIMHSAVQQADNGAYGQVRLTSTLLGPSYGTFISGFNTVAGIQDAFADNQSNAKERQAVREVTGRIPILGGVRGLKEGIVDRIAGEQTQRGGGNGWSGSWGTDFE